MKFNLLVLALLGHIDAESLTHRSHKRGVDAADEPLFTPDMSGKSRLVNQTKLEMDDMYKKPQKWSTLSYGPYEQKTFPWTKPNKLVQVHQPVYWNDQVDRQRGHYEEKPVVDNDYEGYGDSQGQHTGTLAQRLRYVPSAGITLVQFDGPDVQDDLNLQLGSQWKINANRIYDRDGDGVEDNVVKTHRELDEYYKPAVFFPTEHVENTQHGNLPGHY